MTQNAILEGKIVNIFRTEVVTEKFQKRVLWIENKENRYAQAYQIEFHQGATTDLDAVKVGQSVSVEVEIRGNRYVNRRTGEEKIGMFLVAKGMRKI